MSQPIRIVVADDNREMIEYYGRMIPHLGHFFVAGACNGHELVRSCLGLRPDLAVSDIQMPQLDGLSAMERVQCEVDIPFIFVSADDERDHRQRLRRAHVLSYLQKPVFQKKFLTALEAAAQAISA